ncbi:MAG: hypothetical protein IJU86_01100 [Firmicutes bacterium]|nr:hypothetical protein [Bacillota bacterium]
MLEGSFNTPLGNSFYTPSKNEQTNEGLQVQLVEANEKIKNLESKLNQAEEKIEEYELRFENLNTEKKQLEKDLQDDKEVTNRIANDRNELQKQYELLLNQFIDLTGEAENKNIDVAKYKSQVNDMQEILTKQNNDLNNLANDNQYLYMRNMKLFDQRFKMQNQIDDLKGAIVAKELYNQERSEIQANEIDDLKGALAAHELYNQERSEIQAIEMEKLKKQNDNLQKQIAALQNKTNSDSLIDKTILGQKCKKTHSIIGISLAVVGSLLIISPFIIPSIFGMGGVIFGSVVWVSSLFSVPALFYGNQNLDGKKLDNIGLDRKTIVKDGAFFKKVSGLVLGIGLILAGLLCLAFPHLALFYFLPQAITNVLYLVCAVFGAYLTSRFYAIKQPEFKHSYGKDSIDYNVDSQERSNEINDPNLRNNNFDYYNNNQNQFNVYDPNMNRNKNEINENNNGNGNDYLDLPELKDLYPGQDQFEGNNQNIDNNYRQFD